jgi:hypothetical protein
LSGKQEIFRERQKESCDDLTPEWMIKSKLDERTKTLHTNNQSQAKFDLSQHSSRNMHKLIRDSRGQNNGN